MTQRQCFFRHYADVSIVSLQAPLSLCVCVCALRPRSFPEDPQSASSSSVPPPTLCPLFLCKVMAVEELLDGLITRCRGTLQTFTAADKWMCSSPNSRQDADSIRRLLKSHFILQRVQSQGVKFSRLLRRYDKFTFHDDLKHWSCAAFVWRGSEKSWHVGKLESAISISGFRDGNKFHWRVVPFRLHLTAQLSKLIWHSLDFSVHIKIALMSSSDPQCTVYIVQRAS